MGMDSHQNLYFSPLGSSSSAGSYKIAHNIYSFNTTNGWTILDQDQDIYYKNFNQQKKLGTTNTLISNYQGKVDGSGQQASFNYPQGIYFDPISKNLFIADYFNVLIRKMNQSGLIIVILSTIKNKINLFFQY